MDSTKGLRDLLTAVDSFRDGANEELAHLTDEIDSLRKQLDVKGKALSELDRESSELRTQHENEYQCLLASHHKSCTELEKVQDDLRGQIITLKEDAKKYDETVEELASQTRQSQEEIASLRQSLQSRDDINERSMQKSRELEKSLKEARDEGTQIKTALENEQRKVMQLGDARASLEKDNSTLREKFDKANTKLSRFQSVTTKLKTEDLSITTTTFDSMWQLAASVVSKHFRCDLPTAPPEIWRTLKSRTANGVPLPRSNSPAAKDMRYAAILSFLVALLDEKIFQPSYIDDEGLDIRQALLRQAVYDSHAESFYRATLLALGREQQVHVLSRRVESTLTEFLSVVNPLVEPNRSDDLQKDLQKLMEDVCTAWQNVQQLRERFEPNLEYTEDAGMQWRGLQLRDQGDVEDAPVFNGTQDEALLVVFPRVYLVRDAAPKPITSGVVLWGSQAAAAMEEVRNEAPSSPTFGRGYQAGSRAERYRRESMTTRDRPDALTFLGGAASVSKG